MNWAYKHNNGEVMKKGFLYAVMPEDAVDMLLFLYGKGDVSLFSSEGGDTQKWFYDDKRKTLTLDLLKEMGLSHDKTNPSQTNPLQRD